MTKLSIVIISFNSSRKLKEVLTKASKLSEDLIVVDSGSTDSTQAICQEFQVQFYKQEWQGYGKQKNIANSKAKHDWILSLDADEVLSSALIEEIQNLELQENHVYNIPFRNIYCHKEIKFGRWKNEHHVRLFNRREVHWDENAVHEGLHLNNLKKVKLRQPIHHYSMDSRAEHVAKARYYAKMGAEKLKLMGKKATFIKLYINPFYRFVKDYFFSFGFLDGPLGFQIAFIVAKESYWKYKNLKDIS